LGVFLAEELLGLAAQVLEYGVRGGPVDVHLVHEGKGDSVSLLDVLLNLAIALGLLVQELTARKSNDLQSFVFVVAIQLYQRQVVFLGEGSLTGDIDNNRYLFLCHEFF